VVESGPEPQMKFCQFLIKQRHEILELTIWMALLQGGAPSNMVDMRAHSMNATMGMNVGMGMGMPHTHPQGPPSHV